MRKTRKNPRALTAVTWLLILSIMGTWLLSMSVLTVVTAQELYDSMYESSQNYAETVSTFGLLNTFYDDDFSRYGYQYERPDSLENLMLTAIDRSITPVYHTSGPYYTWDPVTGAERNKLIRNISFPLESAVLFYDADGNLLHSSEENVVYFEYYTQEEWDAGRDTTSGLHYGWMDITEGKDAQNAEDDPFAQFRNLYHGSHHHWDCPTFRIKGYFDGTRLIPVILHYAEPYEIEEIVESDPQFSTGPNSYSWHISQVDRTGRLTWHLRFDRSAEYKDQDLVTVYLESLDTWDYQGKPLKYNGVEYKNLAALTKSLDLAPKPGMEYRNYGIFKLNELLIFSRWTGADFSNKAYLENGGYTVDFELITAIRSNPLLCAVSALRNIYIVTGLLSAALLLTVRGRIKRRLITPIAETANAMERHWDNLHLGGVRTPMWQEAAILAAGFDYAQDMRRMKNNEITRLNTALDYAKTAEQNRRQMTSNIAHELKTPLAVIHSYAEGLKEHIAEDKRDQYIDVILSEAERTDSMVLEMLDLSRLEAGKIKLSRDEFDLAVLTRAVFEKLELTIRSKDLQLTYDCPDSCPVTADEGRIAQVVENFATNAVKYTPEGGSITVRIQSVRSKVTLSMENDSPRLSEETLSKVWDTFYRTDESRTAGGTGLGLAIAKNIVELHGGKCSACNTRSGVEFSFTLP